MDKIGVFQYIPSRAVMDKLGDIVVNAALQLSQDQNDPAIRTRSRMEEKKEQVAGWVDTMFWFLRSFLETGRELPSNGVLAMVMMKQDASHDLDNSSCGQEPNCSPTEEIIQLAEKLLDAVRLSVLEENNQEKEH